MRRLWLRWYDGGEWDGDPGRTTAGQSGTGAIALQQYRSRRYYPIFRDDRFSIGAIATTVSISSKILTGSWAGSLDSRKMTTREKLS